MEEQVDLEVQKEYPELFANYEVKIYQRQIIQQYSLEELQAAFHTTQITNAVDQLIAIGDAAFEFIWHSELEVDLKNAFHQLHLQFSFFSRLLESARQAE